VGHRASVPRLGGRSRQQGRERDGDEDTYFHGSVLFQGSPAVRRSHAH
jgi:hypothetical protein